MTRVEIGPPSNGSSEHCIPPAVTQFPHPLLDKEQRQQGGVILHVVVAFYMFIGEKTFSQKLLLSFSNVNLFLKLNSTKSRNLVIIMIILHFSVWLGLAIVCEDYFVPSLNRVSDGKWFSNPRLCKIFALIIDFTSCFSSGSLPGCGGRHLHGSRELRS